MKHFLFFLFSVVMGSSVPAAPLRLFVAPNGNDANPGTEERPLATLTGARDALRVKRRASGGTLPDGGAVIEIGDGVYYQTEPLELDRRDTGTPAAPIVWKAARRAGAAISGGFAPKGWRVTDDPEILDLLPKAARGKVLTVDLPPNLPLPGFRGGGNIRHGEKTERPFLVFQGGERLTVARWPNEGFAKTGECLGQNVSRDHSGVHHWDGIFRFNSPRLAAWAREPDLWFYGLWYHEWADLKTKALKVDPSAQTLTVDTEMNPYGHKANADFYAFNAVSEIDRPGEWVLDRVRHRLYLWPLENMRARPVLTQALKLLTAKDLTNVVFDGLIWEYARGNVASFSSCSGVVFRASIVRRTCAWAVTITGGSDCRVEGCDMYDLGEGGILLNSGDFNRLIPARHTADNNHIHHYGRVTPNYKPGISLLGVGNAATHNLIHHSQHQAIGFGGNDHRIAFNVIHDTCTWNDDAGSIYCCQRDWAKRGTVIEHNLIHMTGKQPRATHTEAIYLDDFSSGVIVRNNLINRASIGVYIGGGQDCTVSGNIIMNATCSINLGSRGIESFAKFVSLLGRESNMFKQIDRNLKLYESPLWKTRYPNLLRVRDFEDAAFAHNALFNRISNNVCVTCGDIVRSNWKKVAPYTVLTNNLTFTEDPGFTDYAHFGWDLKPGTPARQSVGDLRLSEMGLYDSPARISPAIKFAPDVTPPRPLSVEYNMAGVRVDLSVKGDKLPPDIKAIARAGNFCDVPEWAHGKRICADFGTAPVGQWQSYTFTFTPNLDGALIVDLMGVYGEMTLYDDFKVTGATLKSPGFETPDGWRIPEKDIRSKQSNRKRPFGIIPAQGKFIPAEGRMMASANHEDRVSQIIRVQKDVPVTFSFKACAFME